jgi:hypothetical protein
MWCTVVVLLSETFSPFSILITNQDSSVGIATAFGLDSRSSRPGRGKISLFATTYRPFLGSTQPPMQWVPGGGLFPLDLKRPGREAGHSPLSSVEVKNTGTVLPLPQMP